MNRTLRIRSLVAVVGLACGAGAFAGDWKIVPETSSVAFTGSQQGTKFNGRFGTFTAHISLDVKDPTKGSVAGTVQLDSVNTRDHDRDSQLLEKDWFNVKEFPEAKFESQKIERAADGSYQATGKLTLKGTTKPALLTFTFGTAPSGPAGSAQFAGAMKINRFDYNVGEGWNDTSWVSQDVAVEIKLDLKQ